jgi:hypothetical protein
MASNAASEDWFLQYRERIEVAIRASVADALSNLKRLGIPAAGWKDGRVVSIPPEEIVVDEKAIRDFTTLRKFLI